MQLWKYFALPMILSSLSPGPRALAAEDAAPASFSFQYSGIKWNSTTNKDLPAIGKETERKTTSILTSDLADSMVYATIENWNLYLYPFQDRNAFISASYMLQPDLELGVNFGLNNNKAESPNEEQKSTLYGVFGTWIKTLGTMSLENLISLDSTQSKSTSVSTLTNQESTTEETGLYIKATSQLLIPLAKNAYYMGGFWLAMANNKDKVTGDKSNHTQYGITFAGLRISVQ